MDSELSYSSLNTHRAALNLIIHQSSNDDKILKRFWKGVYNIRPPKPKYQSTWDPQPVLSFCLATNSGLEFYVKKTKSYRCTNCYLILTHKKPIHKATTQTISRWLKDILKKERINTEIFCGHSTRHAATSAAFRSGINIDTFETALAGQKRLMFSISL
nr:unnamed protein product [Callosobruchus chinensis]